MIVEQFGSYPDKNGNPVEGVNCVNLRGFSRGLKGAVIAFAVLIVSISVCGSIEKFYMRSKLEKSK